ncbi:MAG: hypothetical protein Q9209_007362 [Squamulea sp. 1 TL-2023]
MAATYPYRQHAQLLFVCNVPRWHAATLSDPYRHQSQEFSTANSGCCSKYPRFWRSMVMALEIQTESTKLQVVAGFESGHTMVFVQSDPGAQFQRLYCAQPHTQPILSMAIFPSRDCYLTSSADAVVAKHPLPAVQGIWKTELKPFKVAQTKHSGQQGLQIRSDGKIFATAGWDARVRVYSSKTMKELAVLKWHKLGCYTTAFAEVGSCHLTKAEDDDLVKQEDKKGGDEKRVIHHPAAVGTVQQRREVKAQSTHWLAAGSKDGKISLWDIY